MTTRLAILTATATLAIPVAALAQTLVRTATPDACRTGPRLAARLEGPLRARPLAKEPNAAQVAAVWRRDHRGCPTPIVLKTDIGSRR